LTRAVVVPQTARAPVAARVFPILVASSWKFAFISSALIGSPAANLQMLSIRLLAATEDSAQAIPTPMSNQVARAAHVSDTVFICSPSFWSASESLSDD
jgi:hypothetical protein